MVNHLQEAEVVKVEEIGEGARVCLDLVDQLQPTEGILLGNTGHGYFFILGENRTTDTYPARSFRINSGAIHHYVVKEEETTAYLAELKPGDMLPIYNEKGETHQLAIGRVKIEKRPLMRIVAKVGDTELSATLQKADSVHLLTSDHEEKQAISLQAGDRILVKVDQPGRHLGERIEEEIIEF
ncbi:3-dehydroquinate synthase II [Gracilibacillus sp. S3-1-1]|uniref:3-dehydroquinate synthase II n=1 Tax=Gracilibacillus pellucidus TaxID=3095368 RepID=A0ACC6M2K1_9BACI|nr:3-dehydroquinate synthase II [Gracilibacillus sp. S3-1-1]MDX8045113.1 3-dehydroquinate synthase II [Gracilibacillus sp. S3-1-1]